MLVGRVRSIWNRIAHNKINDDRLKGLGVAGGQILAFPIDIDRRPYNTLALPCECVINVKKLNSLKRLVRTTVAMSHN